MEFFSAVSGGDRFSIRLDEEIKVCSGTILGLDRLSWLSRGC